MLGYRIDGTVEAREVGIAIRLLNFTGIIWCIYHNIPLEDLHYDGGFIMSVYRTLCLHYNLLTLDIHCLCNTCM